jgi:hypothetical protein
MEGYFSIQVIMRALTHHGVALSYLDEARFLQGDADPTKETGLVFNRSQHWQAYRKMRNVWYDLNSLRRLPNIISEFSLSSHIEAMISNGFTVFVARGEFPRTDKQRNPSVQPWQQWVAERTIQESGRAASSEDWETDPEEDRLLKQAIEDSKRDANRYVPRTNGSIEDPELAAAIALSLQSENVQPKPSLPHIEIGPEPIDPMAFAVKVKFPDGVARTRKFMPSDNVLVIMLWVQSVTNLEVTMTFPYPRRILDTSSTLLENGVTPNSNYLIAEHLRNPT